MKRTYLLSVAAILLAAPFAYAHQPTGTSPPYGVPKDYCEDGIFAAFDDTRFHDYASVVGVALSRAVDGATPPCPYDPIWDGHPEWAFGGAWLLACDYSCPTLSGKSGDGAVGCWETYADHWDVSPFNVFAQDASGATVQFMIAADHWDNVPPTPEMPNCGDFESDVSGLCTFSCVPGFPPGKDGSYEVYVCDSAAGHVWTDALTPAPAPTTGSCLVSPTCTDLPNSYDLPDGGSTPSESVLPGCTRVVLHNHFIDEVELVFNTLLTCGPVPAHTVEVCIIPPGALSYHIRDANPGNGAYVKGTYQQV